MRNKIAKFISYITVVPIVALGILTLLYFADGGHFHDRTQYILAVIYLTVLPILAYPMQKILPKFKNEGRDGQRKLAFIMGVLGYTLGIISAIVLDAPVQYLVVYLTYFSSGLVLTFFNKVLKIKASGHACGVMGPIVLCVFFIGKYSWILLSLMPMVFWSRMKMGRHTMKELYLGTGISLACAMLSILIIY